MNGNRHRDLSELEWLLQKVEILRTAWKLVFITFLTMSILGCAAVFATARPVYSSHMVLPLTSNLQALIYTDVILAPVARNVRLQTSAPDISFEPQDIASRLVVSELKKGSDLFSVTVTDNSPQGAKALLDQVFSQLAAASRPTGTARDNVQQQIESLIRALTELKELSAALKENAQRAKGGVEGELYARSYVILVTDIAAKEQRIRELQNYLEGIKIEDVMIPPSLSSKPNFPGFNRKLALVVLVSLLLPISFVFLRDLRRKRDGSHSDALHSIAASGRAFGDKS
jgi:hypothetical protein